MLNINTVDNAQTRLSSITQYPEIQCNIHKVIKIYNIVSLIIYNSTNSTGTANHIIQCISDISYIILVYIII